MTMKIRWFLMGFAALAMVFAVAAPNTAHAVQKKSKAELDAAKKAGDLSVEEAQKFRDAFGKEADEANIETFDSKTSKRGSGTSTYGVAGFDYLTGVGKVASDPSRIGANLPDALGGGVLKASPDMKSPLEGLMKKRFKKKWTGQLGETYSGWTEQTGVTEVWFRKAESGSALGADYNQWVNQWNNITRPRHDGKTTVAGADPDQGAHWFSYYCIHCHGWTGKGDGPTAATLDPRPRNLTNGKYANFISNLDLFAVIKGGGAARSLSEAMPPWGNILQDQDIWNVVAFIRSLAAKPTYADDGSDVTAASSRSSDEFNELNEELELPGVMAGRGANEGGYNSVGGGRLSSKQVGVNPCLKTSDTDPSAMTGDWAQKVQYDK